MRLAAGEIDAFHSAFILDPLLPGQLLPVDYKGRDVVALHRQIADGVRRKLIGVNPD